MTEIKIKRCADKENLKKLMRYIKATFANKYDIVPAGGIIPFAGTSVPSGYLLCNGAAVSRTNYANLFAAIGTLYGAGDGSTTFNLPDARDRVLQGASGTHSTGSYIAAGLPNIMGVFDLSSNIVTNLPNAPIVFGASGVFSLRGEGVSCYTNAAVSGSVVSRQVNFNASRSSSYYGASTKPQVDAVAINFIIKY